MYVVLQGIESLTCIRVYTKFPLGSNNLVCLKFLNWNISKKRSPEMINFILYCIKKMSFLSSPKGTPQDRCRRTMIKTTVQ